MSCANGVLVPCSQSKKSNASKLSMTDIVTRPAEMRDVENVFFLSNDPAVRQNSIHQEPIVWDEHVTWFNDAVANPNLMFYVAETVTGDFVGQVRFLRDKGEWVVSISVSGSFRRRGVGAEILLSAMRKSRIRDFVAFVKAGNAASQNMFAKCGYKSMGTTTLNGESFCIWKYSYVFVIAEMSANHCGDKNLAKQIIAAAKDCGVDAVKLQTYTADTMTIDSKNDCFKISGGTVWDGKFLYDLYKDAYTPWEWQKELKDYADEVGIELFSTPFDKISVDFLESIGVRRYKIASFEAVDIPLVRYAASKGKPMIVSVGICSLEEIQDVVDACKAEGNNDLTLLKCTSAYPAKLEDMNLATIPDMISRFGSQGVKIGLSDHSMDVETVVAGVALGARVVEKHFTLDRKLGGADAAFSLNPEEMAATVRAIRNTERLLGRVDYTVNQSNRKFARSLFAVKDIKAGEQFTNENVRSIRPGDGLPPKVFGQIIGRAAMRNIKCGTPLSFDDIGGV